jgi:hypothetical protein
MMTQKIRQLGSLPSGPFVSLFLFEASASVKRVATKIQTITIDALARHAPGSGRGELAV